MTEAMPFLRKLITFLWPPDIGQGIFVFCLPNRPSFESLGAQLQLLDLEGVTGLEGLQDRLSDTQKDLVPNL